MSSSTDPNLTGPKVPPSITCSSCHQPVADHYFEINRTIVCEPCRSSIEGQFRGERGFARFWRAALFGVGGMAVGMAIHLSFLSVFAFDTSVFTVVIGYLVGKLVRKGSGGVGGRACQVLAVALTYVTLGLTYFTFTLITYWQQDPIDRPFPITPADVLALWARP